MFKKKDKLSVGRPKLADSNLKKMSLLISVICFVMVIGLIFGGLLDLNIIGNTSKLKADVSTLCTSIPDSLKYDENTNPYGFKDVEFFSGVLEHGHVSGDAREVYRYNDSSYCTSITKEDLEKIDRVDYSNNTISSANGIQLLTNLEILNLSSDASSPNYNITSIDLSHNTKLNAVYLVGLLNIKDFDFSNNTELLIIQIGRALYPTSYNINSLIIKNNSKLKTMTNAFTTATGYASIMAGSINNLDIENSSLKKDNNSKFEVTENLKLENVDSSLLPVIKNETSLDESYGLKKIYLKDINSGRESLSVNSNRLDEVYIDNFPCNIIRIENKSSNPISTFYLNNIPSLQELSITGDFGNNKIDFGMFPKLYTLNLFNTKISNIDLSNNSELETLQIFNSNLKQINLSNNKSLSELVIDSTDIKSIDLSNNTNLKELSITRTGINALDLSKLTNLQMMLIANNIDKDIYLKSNDSLDYNDLFNMNSKYNIKYESKDDKIASVLNGVIKGLKPGSTTIFINNDSIESYSKKDINAMLDSIDNTGEINGDYETTKTLLEINVHVYDVTSEKYNIDDKTKTIDLKKSNIDLNEIKLGIDSLVKEVSENKLYIKDGSGNIIDEYTLVNKKEDEKESIKEEVKTTAKKKTTIKKDNAKKSSTKKNATTKKVSETTTTTIKSDNDKENTKVVTNEKVVEKIAYKSNNLTLIIINIIEGILLLVLAILFIKSMRKSK